MMCPFEDINIHPDLKRMRWCSPNALKIKDLRIYQTFMN